MDKCPKCGAMGCGSIVRVVRSATPEGSTLTAHQVESESITCLRRQLAAANERAGRLEKALAFYADPLKHNLMGEVNEDHGAIARKALEVPDAL